jgi:hypothetical protein
MTVAELIEKLEKVNPYLVVRVWDTRTRGFTDRFYVETATYDDELLVTPSQGGAKELPQNEWQSLFEEASSDHPPAHD